MDSNGGGSIIFILILVLATFKSCLAGTNMIHVLIF